MIASAPGKLLLLGEYAVLDGAPAAVVAVDRRARATLRPIDGAHAWVHAPDLEASAQLDLARCAWLDARAGRRLELVRRCVDVVAAEVGHALAPFELTLDSAAFVGESGKLGLGSSAAVCVVSAAALLAHGGRADATREIVFEAALAAHRRWQSGRSSGTDIAASAFGGVLRYQIGEAPSIAALRWPAGVGAVCVYSGKPASTSKLVQRVDAFAAARPDAHRAIAARMRELAERGCEALAAGDSAAFIDAYGSYGAAMAELGEAAEADIVSAAHRRIGELVREVGGAYKPCGAGGGDVGLALCDAERVGALQAKLRQANVEIVELALDAHGLIIEASEVSGE